MTAKNNFPEDQYKVEIEKNSYKSKLDREHVAKMYKKWYESRPFDIGNNTKATIGAMADPKAKGSLLEIGLLAGSKSVKSASDGSMMRLSPLIVWCS